MKKRGPLRLSHVLAVSIVTAGLVYAGFLTQPSSALAAEGVAQPTLSHIISFDSNGTQTQHATQAATVGSFLRERGILVGANDYVAPAPETPLSDRLVVRYRQAVPVTILTPSQHIVVKSAAVDIGALLEEQHVRLGTYDQVVPSLADRVPENGVVRIDRVITWQNTVKHSIAATTIHRLDFHMTPGTQRVIAKGSLGERDVMVQYVQRDGGHVNSSIVGSQIVRMARPRVVAEGAGEFAEFEHFEETGVQRTAYIAASAVSMVATAYTAGCYGCSGITAIGRPAGHGIVAVDPRVIPLGTHLYIPGYGYALAGDTGGAIRGNRIDLGFNSLRDAMMFGRREVTVYRLK